MENVKERARKYLKIINDNWLRIALIVTVVFALGMTAYLYRQKRNNDFNEVWSRIWRIHYEIAVAQQEDPEGKAEAIEASINEYVFLNNNLSTTSATPWLLLELGNTQYNAKKYNEAILTYEEFIKRFSEHTLVPIIRQSLGYAFEENGQLKEAVEQFEKIATDTDAKFLKAQVNLDAGRCNEKLGQLSPAIAAYK
ncbi:MAG TPA: tetratricopeptide repeat protein, partial [Candidatus Scalindua sp.]|nr:tetratricopeptide repeat protein [Candidatus Scalindua sp.]